MTMFSTASPDIDKKIQEIEDEDLRNCMEGQGCSDAEIEVAIRNMHLLDEIRRLEDVLCEPEEILNILLEKGWKKEEIEKAFAHNAL